MYIFSTGVRMSLAETRLVNETRAFLERNGVVLDSFSHPNSQRSDTVIIAKNLPAGVDENELKEKFEKYGAVKRFLLPPGEFNF
jgi:multiple RNA-binding domain-containing protein 1